MSKIEVNTVEPQCGTTLTLGGSGDTVTLGSGASQSGFGRAGSVDWQTGSIKTATFTAADGEGYFCNTTSGSFTVNLPAGSAGAIVAVSDYARTFQTNNLTVAPNGSEKIGGAAASATLSTEGQSATFVYVDATEGWINVQETSNSVTGRTFISATGGNTVATCGNFKIHTFTSPGTFCVSSVSSVSAENTVGYLVLAGGGGGGGEYGGGGGAGGFREGRNVPIDNFTASPLVANFPGPNCNAVTITASAFPITVGGGGAGGSSPPVSSNGNNSVFSTITSAGGGAGRYENPAPSVGSGGSGGGGGGGGCGAAGSGNTPPVTPPQGNNGGSGPQGAPNYGRAGGGGAGGPGASGSTTSGGNGGPGVASSITGSPVTRGGGGGGGTFCAPAPGGAGSGGAGGGGAGSNSAAAGGNGTANTGGGAGGAAHDGAPGCGGTGGSGIVIIRYKYQ
jgi:hypothetical protein